MHKYELRQEQPFYQDGELELLPAYHEGNFAGFRGFAFNRGDKRLVFTQEEGFRVIDPEAGNFTARPAELHEAIALLVEVDRQLDRDLENKGALDFLYREASKRLQQDYP